MIDKSSIIKGAKCELARRSFFDFCNIKAPDFYKPSRQYLVDLCDNLQLFYEGNDDVLVINMPPRHGKSRTAGMFAQWVLGKDQTQQIMTGSYNKTLSTVFSKAVRNGIMEEAGDPNKIIYADIFDGVRVQRGDAAANLWALEGHHANYLATSPDGTATGFGASIIIIDDVIKNAEEANNANALESHWSWFTDTMLSRLEESGKIIVIMTRWATGDLAGRVIDYYKEQGRSIKIITMKAVRDDGTMLCPEILSHESYENKKRAMSPEIAEANYQQTPLDLKGRLYSSFKIYEDIPKNTAGKPLFTEIKAYCDTADEGSDFLACGIYGVYRHEAYMLDVYYTNAAMEITEEETARHLKECRVNRTKIESNNGGRGFARSVQRILQSKFRSNYTNIQWFHQSKNKEARILTNASWVMNHIYMPINWRDRWPEYYKAMTEYQRDGKNKHDDAPDMTTGIAESMTNTSGTRIGW
jgi:phage uncharacterized protein (putative large terminase), C-terminal domain